MRQRLVPALAALALLCGSGCVAPIFIEAAKDPMGHQSALRQAQRDYTKMVRWSDIEGAVKFVHPDLRDEFLSYQAAFDEIRVTDFDVGEIRYGENHATATVRVTYHAYQIASMVEKEIKETQQWERLGAGNHTWVVRPDLEKLVAQVADNG